MANNNNSRFLSGKEKLLVILLLAGIFIPNLLYAQFIQQGPKLVGSEGIGNTDQGNSVAISADGNTAVVGGFGDNGFAGAIWIYTRSGGVWTQQGAKLVGTGVVGTGYQGYSVAISSDGNTVVEGGIGDNGYLGAIWIFTRSAGVWTQQGTKHAGTGGINSQQGYSVAISSDGNTIIEGGSYDQSNTGAVWIFVRNGGVWTQQGSKLIGTGAVGSASQGSSVAISANGNTAIEGGPYDNNQTGAVWVFTRTSGAWEQQGSRLVGEGGSGMSGQGISVATSSDGNTTIVGAFHDNNNAGAVWVFTRSGSLWYQQGPKLTGAGANGSPQLGLSVSISSDGNTFVAGGPADNSGAGAIWSFTRSGNVWSQFGSKLAGTGAIGFSGQGTSVAISSDGVTVLDGGVADNTNAGAVWVFVPSNYILVNSHSNLNGIIQGNQSTLDTITVAGSDLSSYYVSYVNVSIDTIIYPNDGDLEISLLHFTNTDTLIYQLGGSGANFIGTALSDSSLTLISNGAPPFTGNFRPTKPLSQFINFDPSGAWILKVYDRTTGHTGTLNAWTLTLDLTSTLVSVRNISQDVPGGFSLKQNYPNPFNPSTKIGLQVVKTGFVKVTVYDITGKKVAELVNSQLQQGSYEIQWNAADYPSGVYFYTMRTDGYVQTRKMMLIK